VSRVLCVSVMSRWWDERMDTIMKRRRHTPEQAVRKIREGERLLNEGQELVEVLRHLEITEATFNWWRAQYGGMKADEAKRLKSLEVENQRLRSWSLSRRWTSTCSRSWRRETFDPGTQTPRRDSAAAAFRGFPAPGVPCRRPAPLHAAQTPAGTASRMSGSPGGCGRSRASIHAGDGRPLIRSCSGRAGRSTTSEHAASGARRAFAGP
jgi:putative transposase